jgi:chromosome segregation ATPase
MEEDNLDLEASDRFLLDALRTADSVVQQRALRLLGHESWEDRDDNLKEANERISFLSREVENQRQCAREAEQRADGLQRNAHEAERSAEDLSKRVHELEDLLHNARGRLLKLSADIYDKVGSSDGQTTRAREAARLHG